MPVLFKLFSKELLEVSFFFPRSYYTYAVREEIKAIMQRPEGRQLYRRSSFSSLRKENKEEHIYIIYCKYSTTQYLWGWIVFVQC
jgi:hypothetical protein